MKQHWVFGMALLLTASFALADGDGPTRKMNGSEAAAFDALKRSVQEALPRAPANYALSFSDSSGSGELLLPEKITADQMARLQFTAIYTLSQEYRDGRQRTLFTDRVRGTPEQQAQIAALNAKSDELKRRRDTTRDRGEKDRIRAELRAVREEENRLNEQIMATYQAWVAAGGANAAMQDSERSLPAKEFAIRVFVNQEVNLNDQAIPYKLAGFPLAFEQSEGCADFGSRCLSVLLGAFDKEKRVSGYTRYNPRAANLGVPTKPRGLVLVVSGPKEKTQDVRDFLAQVDLAKLKGLLP
ncbi:MAG: hypothetical protein HZB55_19500 [Deltaproteobacteria bacterium]|nr:hypothetical protein [Deltaproteobacteria bacterium]